MTTKDKFNKRAKSKFLQEPLLRALINLKSKFEKKYIDSLNCAGMIYHQGDKLTSRYCFNRWCRVCNRIRTGELINDYGNIIEQMPDKQLVTLTIPNCTAEELRPKIKSMLQVIRKIQEYRRQKLKIPGIDAIRKLECTYNVNSNTYHPHFHFIVSNYRDSIFLRDMWLKFNPDSNINAQDIREAHKPLELFKYFTKLSSGNRETIGSTGKISIKDESQYPEAIDIIFQAIEGIRIIQPMGKIRMEKSEEKPSELIAEQVDESITCNPMENVIYLWNGQNWYSPNTGEMLSNFEPTEKIRIFRDKIRYLKKVPVT